MSESVRPIVPHWRLQGTEQRLKSQSFELLFEASPASIVDLPHIHLPAYPPSNRHTDTHKKDLCVYLSTKYRNMTCQLSIVNSDMQRLSAHLRRVSPWFIRSDWARWNDVGAYRYPFGASGGYCLAIRTRQSVCHTQRTNSS